MGGHFEDKVALVTGGSSGIGRAAALAFAREGAKVVVSDVNAEGGAETVSMMNEANGNGIFVHADVSKTADVEGMINKTVEVYGRLDCAFNNAGVAPGGGSIVECPEEIWDRVVDINLKGIWLCMKHEIPQMLRQGGGAIVNTASIFGLVAWPNGGPAYAASKHGVVGLTKVAALSYAKEGIRVNTVCPGVIRTPMTEPAISNPDSERRLLERHPVGRFGTPEEVAETVIWLCSDAASFVTGHAMAVDGGYLAQ